MTTMTEYLKRMRWAVLVTCLLFVTTQLFADYEGPECHMLGAIK
jgi:hypothetical protein